MIGELLKIDYNTDEEQRCKFARMAVVLNLEKPLVPRVWLNGKSKKVEYEGVPRVCSHCGVYGHVKEVCPKYDPEVENIPKTGEEAPPSLLRHLIRTFTFSWVKAGRKPLWHV